MRPSGHFTPPETNIPPPTPGAGFRGGLRGTFTARREDGLAEWVLEPLSQGLPAKYRRFDWHAMEYAEWNEVTPPEVLAIEGVGSGARLTYLSYLVWVEAPKDLRMRRGVERGGEAFRPHWERWTKQEEAMFEVERTKDLADLLVDGSPETPHDPGREFVGRFAPVSGS